MKGFNLRYATLGAVVTAIACGLVDWHFRPRLSPLDVGGHAVILAALFFAMFYVQARMRLAKRGSRP